MEIQLTSIGRGEPKALGHILPALAEAIDSLDVDHSRLAAVLDWVQYKKNFRAAVMVRPFGDRPDLNGSNEPIAEIAIDVRRAAEMDHEELVSQIADRLSKGIGLEPDIHECIHLEDWVRPSKSVMWSFNRSYWVHLAAWDTTFKKDYASALPGGVSDGTNPEFWADQIGTLMDTLNHLEGWSELPEEIYVLEFGVGDGHQSLVWLEAFEAACTAQGKDYLDRLHYVMADYSAHVLERAQAMVAQYADKVTPLELDFRNPLVGLGHLKGKVLFAHCCNLYDNLPTDELMRVGDRAYEPLVRASITPRETEEIAKKYDISPGEIVETVQNVLRHGPDYFRDTETGVGFWSDVWDSVHLEEIYSEIPSPASMRVAPSADAHLDELLEKLPEWRRVHASTVAIESFAQTLQLLHNEGVLVGQDIFVRDVSQYAAYRGPGKLEGSVLNWLNGPVFELVGERLGFHVKMEDFAYRENSNTVVLTARPRDAFTKTPKIGEPVNATVAS
ncbi:MAG TPA: hypothetical protein VNT22_07775 [Baekduia sp.]|nr:hypothetical protein [Baekduia sp.]